MKLPHTFTGSGQSLVAELNLSPSTDCTVDIAIANPITFRLWRGLCFLQCQSLFCGFSSIYLFVRTVLKEKLSVSFMAGMVEAIHSQFDLTGVKRRIR